MTRQQKAVSKLIEVKEFHREQLEADVKKAKDRLDAEREKLAEREACYARTNDEFCEKQQYGSITVCDADMFTTYLKHVARQIEQQRVAVARCDAELSVLRQAMVEAYKEQKLFERLQDRLDQDQERQANKGEQKEADYGFLTRKAKQ